MDMHCRCTCFCCCQTFVCNLSGSDRQVRRLIRSSDVARNRAGQKSFLAHGLVLKSK